MAQTPAADSAISRVEMARGSARSTENWQRRLGVD